MKKNLDLVAVVLLVVGGLNWGLVAVARFDLVATLSGLEFGQTNWMTRVIYALVGLSAVYVATQFRALARRWATNSPGNSPGNSPANAPAASHARSR